MGGFRLAQADPVASLPDAAGEVMDFGWLQVLHLGIGTSNVESYRPPQHPAQAVSATTRWSHPLQQVLACLRQRSGTLRKGQSWRRG